MSINTGSISSQIPLSHNREVQSEAVQHTKIRRVAGGILLGLGVALAAATIAAALCFVATPITVIAVVTILAIAALAANAAGITLLALPAIRKDSSIQQETNSFESSDQPIPEELIARYNEPPVRENPPLSWEEFTASLPEDLTSLEYGEISYLDFRRKYAPEYMVHFDAGAKQRLITRFLAHLMKEQPGLIQALKIYKKDMISLGATEEMIASTILPYEGSMMRSFSEFHQRNGSGSLRHLNYMQIDVMRNVFLKQSYAEIVSEKYADCLAPLAVGMDHPVLFDLAKRYAAEHPDSFIFGGSDKVRDKILQNRHLPQPILEEIRKAKLSLETTQKQYNIFLKQENSTYGMACEKHEADKARQLQTLSSEWKISQLERQVSLSKEAMRRAEACYSAAAHRLEQLQNEERSLKREVARLSDSIPLLRQRHAVAICQSDGVDSQILLLQQRRLPICAEVHRLQDTPVRGLAAAFGALGQRHAVELRLTPIDAEIRVLTERRALPGSLFAQIDREELAISRSQEKLRSVNSKLPLARQEAQSALLAKQEAERTYTLAKAPYEHNKEQFHRNKTLLVEQFQVSQQALDRQHTAKKAELKGVYEREAATILSQLREELMN